MDEGGVGTIGVGWGHVVIVADGWCWWQSSLPSDSIDAESCPGHLLWRGLRRGSHHWIRLGGTVAVGWLGAIGSDSQGLVGPFGVGLA